VVVLAGSVSFRPRVGRDYRHDDERGTSVLMRVALSGADQRVADLPEDVVRKGLLATLERIPGFEGGRTSASTPSRGGESR
jgi:hypothetical protein